MRELSVDKITQAVKEMCIEANHFLSPDMSEAIKEAGKKEESEIGKKILLQLEENFFLPFKEVDSDRIIWIFVLLYQFFFH